TTARSCATSSHWPGTSSFTAAVSGWRGSALPGDGSKTFPAPSARRSRPSSRRSSPRTGGSGGSAIAREGSPSAPDGSSACSGSIAARRGLGTVKPEVPDRGETLLVELEPQGHERPVVGAIGLRDVPVLEPREVVSARDPEVPDREVSDLYAVAERGGPGLPLGEPTERGPHGPSLGDLRRVVQRRQP